MEETSSEGDGTRCVHGGRQGSKWTKALCLAAVNQFSSVAEYSAADFVYRRYGSPNVEELGAAIATLEGAAAGVATASGMGAILLAILTVCKHGDTVVAPRDVYGGTYDLLSNDMPRFGIEVKLEEFNDAAALEHTLSQLNRKSSLVVVLVESISNPLIRVADVPGIAKACKRHGCLLIVDNTFASPLRNKPLKQGADMVVHSATKLLGGHDDAVAGALVGSVEHVQVAAAMVGRWGLAASPMDAWLVLRGLSTLQVRVVRAWETAAELARRLAECGVVVRCAERCSVLAVELSSSNNNIKSSSSSSNSSRSEGREAVEAALGALRMIRLSPSLGGVCTTVSHSASSSHRALPREERLALGISDGLLRISVGLEDVADLWAELKRALCPQPSPP